MTSRTLDAERGAEERVGDAGVAARRVDEDLVAREPPVGQRVLDHAERGAVLHAAAGVRELELRVDGRRPARCDVTRRRRTSGVLPTASMTESRRRLRALKACSAARAARAARARARAERRARRRAPPGRGIANSRGLAASGVAVASRRRQSRRAASTCASRVADRLVGSRDLHDARPREVPRLDHAPRGRRHRRAAIVAAMRACPSSPTSARRACRVCRGLIIAARGRPAIAGTMLIESPALSGGLEPLEEAHVLLADVDVDEPADPLRVEETVADAGVASLEVLDDLADGGARGGDLVLAAGERCGAARGCERWFPWSPSLWSYSSVLR